MKAGIHPAYEEINVVCACGHTFKTRSAHKGDIRVEICSNCHPFFTGKQKLIDTEGRVDRFQKKYQKVRDAQAAILIQRYRPGLACCKGRIRGSKRLLESAWAAAGAALLHFLSLFPHDFEFGLLGGREQRADLFGLVFRNFLPFRQRPLMDLIHPRASLIENQAQLGDLRLS
jgi:large subunit ribosomal protein L31